MIRRVFQCAKNEDYGFLGWRPVDMPNADPLMGMTVAHDLMEHFRGDNGGVEAEFMALGAALYIRGEGGFFSESRYTPAESVAADVPDLMRHIVHEGFSLNPAPHRTRATEETEPCDAVLQAVEFENGDDGIADEWARSKWNALDWLRIGYRKAKRRYAGIDPWDLTYIFRQIAEAADRHLESAEGFETLVVEFSPRSMSFDVRVEYPDF